MNRSLCWVCQTMMDPWLVERGEDAHPLCAERAAAGVDSAKRSVWGLIQQGKPFRLIDVPADRGDARLAVAAAMAAGYLEVDHGVLSPVLARPYTQDGEPSAGHSGTETSKAAEPYRAARQAEVLRAVESRGVGGATVAEVRESTGLHHGIVSGALSALAKSGHIYLTDRKRDRCGVYRVSE